MSWRSCWTVAAALAAACGRDAAPPPAEPRPEPPPPLAPTGPRPPTIAAHTGAHQWSLRAGGPSDDGARSIAVDKDGGVAVTGFFTGEVDFGDGVPLAALARDAFLARYDAKGALRWVKRLGGNEGDEGNAVRFAPDGDLVVTGSYTGEVSFGGDKMLGLSDEIFLARYSPDGEHRWSKRFGGEGSDSGTALALDDRGNIALTGAIADFADFGGGPMTSIGLSDIFVAVFSPTGEHLWSRRDGDTEEDFGRGLAFDARGDLYFIGDFSRRIAIGATKYESAGNRDILLVKYDRAGAPLWSRQFGNHFPDLGVAVAVDRDGDVLFTGSFALPVDFGGETLTSAGGADLFVARYTPDGSPRWTRRLGGPREDIGSGLAVDVDGNAVVIGWFWDEVACGDGTLTSAGKTDALLAVFDPAGAPVLCRRFGGADADFGKAVALDAAGGIAVAGTFRDAINLGGADLTATSAADAVVRTGDVFVARFAP